MKKINKFIIPIVLSIIIVSVPVARAYFVLEMIAGAVTYEIATLIGFGFNSAKIKKSYVNSVVEIAKEENIDLDQDSEDAYKQVIEIAVREFSQIRELHEQRLEQALEEIVRNRRESRNKDVERLRWRNEEILKKHEKFYTFFGTAPLSEEELQKRMVDVDGPITDKERDSYTFLAHKKIRNDDILELCPTCEAKFFADYKVRRLIRAAHAEVPIDDKYFKGLKEALIKVYAGEFYEPEGKKGGSLLFSKVGTPIRYTKREVALSMIYLVELAKEAAKEKQLEKENKKKAKQVSSLGVSTHLITLGKV